jgi:hypothetical protein
VKQVERLRFPAISGHRLDLSEIGKHLPIDSDEKMAEMDGKLEADPDFQNRLVSA